MADRAREIFQRVIECPVARRDTFLDGACGADSSLRRQVEALLQAHEDAGVDALTREESAGTSGVTVGVPHGEESGSVIGRYKLLEPIGEGGFGTVWMAEQREPIRRRVALKIIKPGMDSRQVIARFEAERQALALMEHPNIAEVLDAGATATGRPYFVMELVKGAPITDYCDQRNLSIEERLRLYTDVCAAVQHAHQKGVIHRDIKPSNVLVTTVDDRPVPKVIDFGIAKAMSAPLTERTLFTEQRQMIGTPAYMSPEQASLTGRDIDTRSDVYSLGVLLYELLTSVTPFDERSLRAAGLAEIQRIIREQEPPRPSTRLDLLSREGSLGGDAPNRSDPSSASRGATARTSRSSIEEITRRRRTDPRSLMRQLRGDLDWIVMKCLEKERSRRYETANGLAADIQRHLDDEPVVAGPPSSAYRLRKFTRRHRLAVAGASLMALTLMIGVVGTTWGMLWARSERDRAQRELDRATEVKRFVTGMLGSIDPEIARGRDTTLVREMLDDAAARLESGEIEDDLIEAELRTTVGDAYFSIGDVRMPDPHLTAALEIRRRLLGDEQLQTVETISRLGLLRAEQGQYDEAIALHREALALRRRLLGGDHPDTIESIRDLGRTLQARGDLAEADPLYHEALERSRRALGPDHRTTLSAIHQMGALRLAQGQLSEAEELFRESLDGSRAMFGDEHVSTMATVVMMGAVLQAEGRFAESEEYLREALEIGRRVLGPDHPITLASLNNLGSFLQTQGRLDEAEPLLREAVERTHRMRGDEHPEALQTDANLAAFLAVQGKLDEAEALLRQTLETTRRVLGDEHRQTGSTLNTLGFLLYRQGRFDEAEPCLQEVLSLRRRLLGDDHPDTLGSLTNLAGLWLRQERHAEAEPLYREALEGRRRALGRLHPDTLASVKNLGALLEQTGRLPESLDLYREAVEIVREASPDDPAWLASHLARFSAVALRSNGREWHEAARSAATECLDLRAGLFPDDHPQVWLRHNAANLLGGAMLAEGRAETSDRSAIERFQEAETLLVDSADWMLTDSRMPTGNAFDTQAAQRVIDLYMAWHQRDPGGGHDRNAQAWSERLARHRR